MKQKPHNVVFFLLCIDYFLSIDELTDHLWSNLISLVIRKSLTGIGEFQGDIPGTGNQNLCLVVSVFHTETLFSFSYNVSYTSTSDFSLVSAGRKASLPL